MTDRDEKGDDLADRMSRRFGGDTERDDDETVEEPEAEPAEAKSASETESSDDKPAGNVSDRPSVLMYLPEQQRRELDLRFDELNLEHKREHGEALQKNRDYYPAVVEAALTGEPLEDILLEEE